MTLEMKSHDDTSNPDLYFTKADLVGVVPHDNDSIVISVLMVGRKVHRTVIGQLVVIPRSVEASQWMLYRISGGPGGVSRIHRPEDNLFRQRGRQDYCHHVCGSQYPLRLQFVVGKILIEQVRSSSIHKTYEDEAGIPQGTGDHNTIQPKGCLEVLREQPKEYEELQRRHYLPGGKGSRSLGNRTQSPTSTRTSWRRPRKGNRRKIVHARCLYGEGTARPDSRGDS